MVMKSYTCKNPDCKKPGPKTRTEPMPYKPKCLYCDKYMQEAGPDDW